MQLPSGITSMELVPPNHQKILYPDPSFCRYHDCKWTFSIMFLKCSYEKSHDKIGPVSIIRLTIPIHDRKGPFFYKLKRNIYRNLVSLESVVHESLKTSMYMLMSVFKIYLPNVPSRDRWNIFLFPLNSNT